MPAASRHSRKCSVCRHPKRNEIEQAFIHWVDAVQIALDYGFESPWTIYRHAKALGLYQIRSELVRHKVDRILELSSGAKVTGGHVIQAIRLSCYVDERERPRTKEPRAK